MKTTILVERAVEIKKLVINVSPRYIGDTDEDDMPTDFPGLNDLKNNWMASVDIDTGQIEGWPTGDAREMHIKVCDAGIYSLYDVDGDCVATINGYVPNGVVPGSYGDYIELKIDENGFITNWPKLPNVEEFFERD